MKPPRPVPAKAGANSLEPYAYLRHVFTELPKAQSLPDVEFSGAVSVIFVVRIFDDSLSEDREHFTFRITSVPAGYSISSTNPSYNGYINDNDDSAPSFGTGSVPAKSFTYGTAITEFQIPAATGGNGGVSYSVSGLPAGLVFDASGTDTNGCPGTEPREVCGTPTGGGGTVTVTARDADSNTASSDEDTLTFSVSVASGATLASNPATFTEANLNGAALTVTLPSGVTFASGVSASSFELVTSPAIAGLSIGNVAGGASGTRTATLTLATGAGYGFSTASTLAVRVLAAAHSGSTDLTSGTLAVSPTPGVTLSRRSLALEEDPGTSNAHRGTYTVVLDSPPTGCTAVLGNITSNNADVTASPSNRGFSSDSNNPTQAWNRPQTFTVTAAHDGDSTHTVALANATFASDATASSFALLTDIRNVTVSQVSGGVMGTTSATLTLSFTGDSSFTAVETLAVRVPAAAHTGSSDLTTGTVVVTPTPGIALSRTTLALEEDPTAGGGTNANVGTYTVRLTADPTPASGNDCLVTLDVTSNNADVTIDTDSTPLTKRLAFTGSNWSTPQTVTVTAAGDGDGVDDVATISHPRLGAGCPGGFFGNPTLPSVTVTVNDDETTGVVVSPATAAASRLRITEAGGTATFTVRLVADPALVTQASQAVTVSVSSRDTGEGRVSPPSLAFTAGLGHLEHEPDGDGDRGGRWRRRRHGDLGRAPGHVERQRVRLRRRPGHGRVGDHDRRRRCAGGDAVPEPDLDCGERRDGDGEGDAEPRVGRGDGGGERLFGGLGGGGHHRRLGGRHHHHGHGDDYRGGQRRGRAGQGGDGLGHGGQRPGQRRFRHHDRDRSDADDCGRRREGADGRVEARAACERSGSVLERVARMGPRSSGSISRGASPLPATISRPRPM